MNPVEQLARVFWIEGAVEMDFILLLDVETGMRQLFGEFPRVGHEEETGALKIETAYVVELAKTTGDQFVDRLATLRVIAGAQVTFRFVEDEGKRGILTKHLAVTFDVIPFMHPCAEINDELAVDLDTTLLD